ncbi:tRNA pseudouridine(13) synthase TruD [Thermodesulfovibrio hydrogeniphilus]
MSYKIKVKPEDFIVKEITNLEIRKKGQYTVYLLKKTNWNTVELLKRIAKRFKIPFENISYGGKKDRHAITEQFITVKNCNKDLSLEEENFSIKKVGFSDVPMDPKHIEGNVFKITVRDVSEKRVEFVLPQIEKIQKYGFINYFDDQRFGSFDPKQGFIAEKILKKHYNGALKIYLTHVYPEDKKEAKERKKFFYQNWGNWQLCLEKAKTQFEQFAFQHLTDNPKDYITVLRKIHREEMSMFFSAYQSFLWNETARRLVLKLFDKDNLLSHRGIAGDYIFFDEPDLKNFKNFQSLQIPTASSKAKMPDRLTEKIYFEILAERELSLPLFNLKKIRQAFFKSVERTLLSMPFSLKYKVEKDDIYEDKKKILLGFILPRGAYATMLIKRLFAKKSRGD